MLNIKEIPLALTAKKVKAVNIGMKTEHRAPFNFDFDIDVKAIRATADILGQSVSQMVTSAYRNGAYGFDCHLGNVGDHIWVKEEWRIGAWNHDNQCFAIDYRSSPELKNTTWLRVDDDEASSEGFYRVWSEVVDELGTKEFKTCVDGHYHWLAGESPLNWRSADSMPRWASRITLEITDISIQRVLEVSGQEAYAEGSIYPRRIRQLPIQVYLYQFAMESFDHEWRAAHGDKSFFGNDFIWALKFKLVENRCKTNVDKFNNPVDHIKGLV